MSQDNASRDNNDDNNLANNQKEITKNGDNLIDVKEANDNKKKNNDPNQLDNCCCTCSEKTKCCLRIIFFPCYLVYGSLGCFWDNRCDEEPYYQGGLFKDNVVFCILSIIDMVLVIIYKGQLSTLVFVFRIISDTLGILIFLVIFGLWTEEATDEDHVDPAGCFFTIVGNIITILLDITCIVLFFISDFKSNIILLISLIVHLVVPIIFPFLICCCDYFKYD